MVMSPPLDLTAVLYPVRRAFPEMVVDTSLDKSRAESSLLAAVSIFEILPPEIFTTHPLNARIPFQFATILPDSIFNTPPSLSMAWLGYNSPVASMVPSPLTVNVPLFVISTCLPKEYSSEAETVYVPKSRVIFCPFSTMILLSSFTFATSSTVPSPSTAFMASLSVS